MRGLFNKVGFGLMALTIGAVSVTGVLAQEDEKATTYAKFTACYKVREEAPAKECITVGKDYLTKFGTKAPDEPDAYTKFVSAQVTNLEKWVASVPLTNAYKQRDAGFTSKNWKEIAAGGRAVSSLETKDSLKLDNELVVAIGGYDMAFVANADPSIAPEAANVAKSALSRLNAGISTEPKKCATGTTAPTETTWGGCAGYGFGSKENAQAWMNFMIGRLIVDTNKDKARNFAVLKEGAPYFYKSVQFNPVVPTDASYKGFKALSKDSSYNALGRYYLEEYNASVDQWDTTCKAAANDPTAVETDECKRIIGMQKAYAERAADATARAYNSVAASTDPKVKAYKEGLLKRVTDLYNARFKKTDGVNDFIAKAVASPLADPTAQVSPILETPPATPATTGTAPATTPAKPAGTTAPATKPAGAAKTQN